MLIIALICMTLLVGLIFYVYNLGTVVNRRMALQHASDAAVISASGWMARSMNTVAMNNCETSRLLAMVTIFDSLPLATSLSLAEIAPWTKRLDDQIARSVPETPANYSLLISGLRTLRDRVEKQRLILVAMDTQLNRGAFDMRQTTYWNPPGGGRGALWQAMEALDRYSEATVESAGTFAQSEAVNYGRLNRATVCFVVPVKPEIPAFHGTFRSFQPTLEGNQVVTSSGANMAPNDGNGGAIPDMVYPYRLGPWAMLFLGRRGGVGWRDPHYSGWVPGPWVQPSVDGHVTWSGRVPPGAPQGGTDGYQSRIGIVDGYTTYGPVRWAMDRIRDYARGSRVNPGPLADTDFYSDANLLSLIKLTYMFGSTSPQYIHEPNWVLDYNQAQQIHLDNPAQVYRTMVYEVHVFSSVPENDPRWLTPGTFLSNVANPNVYKPRGWYDPPLDLGLQLHRIGDYVWKGERLGFTPRSPQIGITEKLDPVTHQPIQQPVYLVYWYVWGGIDIGGNVPVGNPCEGHSDSDPPAPWLLDISKGEYNPSPDHGARRSAFSFFAVARSGSSAPFWSSQFRPALADDLTAVAQAKLFNHSSWDLWTQDWQVQLTPVTQWQDWMGKMKTGAEQELDGSTMPTQDEVLKAWTYLHRMQRLADVGWMTH